MCITHINVNVHELQAMYLVHPHRWNKNYSDGIILDAIIQEIQLPPQKLQQLLTLVQEWQAKCLHQMGSTTTN